MNLIGIQTDTTTVYDSINNFQVELDEEKNLVVIYRENRCLGYLSNVIGIDEDEFIKEVKINGTKCN